MSAVADGLSPAAGSLLLDILEAREPVISAITIEDHFPPPGQDLIDRGLLGRNGTVQEATMEDDAEDHPVSIVPGPDETLGYVSPASGWVTIPPHRLTQWRLDI